MAAKFCSKCGSELKSENSCCPQCFTFHGVNSGQGNKAVSKCPKCRQELKSGHSLCTNCGTWHGKW